LNCYFNIIIDCDVGGKKAAEAGGRPVFTRLDEPAPVCNVMM
jgi:hypothetical protein